MPRILYTSKRFGEEAQYMIANANRICREYQDQGYDLTLRQLYYQFVARDLLDNKMSEYNRLGRVVNDARMAGKLDWDYIVDRTRNLESLAHWDNPQDIINAVARSYRLAKWDTQPVRVEVWVEKEALAGVVERICNRLDVPYLACRGYMSQSEQWSAGQRMGRAILENRQRVVVLHLGDHDPSGIDMTRDIQDRLTKFVYQDWFNDHDCGSSFGEIRTSMQEHIDTVEQPLTVNRIALNMNQVQQYNPPPNPAKLTDTRANDYIAIHGSQSWELDALPPNVLSDLIEGYVDDLRDDDAWDEVESRESRERTLLSSCSGRWNEIVDLLEETEEEE